MLVLGVSTVSLAAASIAAVAVQPAAASATGGSGASLPYAEVQAENSATNGTVIGPSYTQGQLADEASGRKAVTLKGAGQYVTFTTPAAANSIDFRYSIPDSADGSVYTAPLSLYINGVKQADFTVTNAYSWYYGSYPFTNTPGSNPHHFYDEVHRLFATTYPAGTTFKLQIDSADTASSYTIDFADFEQAGPALTQPAGSVSVTSEGADPTGASDSTNAFSAAISAAGAGGTVWIPPGTYNIPGHISVNNVTIDGAGMWYSTITGTAPGFYGNSAPNPSTSVHLQNFAISGNVQDRCDSCQVNGIGGAMSNSTVSNIWIEHMKVGAWMDGPMDSLTFSGMRIRDTTADGINFHGGVTNSKVTNSDIRNTGDDGIATWADASIGADSGDTISGNTVQLQQLANGIAIYGGHDNTVSGNLVVDTGITQGGGIQVGQRFSSTPVGTTTISGNTMIRDGDLDPNWNFGVGALWFDGSQGAVTGPINVSNALIEQSPFEAIQWVEGTISGVNLSNVTISGTGTFALQEQTGGTASAANVVATGVAQANAGNPPSYSCEGGNFTITDGGGNSGITPTQCNGWPAPVYPPYPDSGVTVSPTALNFGSVATGTTSAAQTVTVSNPASSAAPVSSVTASGDFAQTSTCGSSIPGGGSCTVSVTFTPAATGTRTGTLTVTAGGTASAVSLTGTGTTSGGGSANLALNQPITASSYTQNYVPANANDGNASTYWEGTNGVWPTTLTVNLGATDSLSSVVVDLPPSSTWPARTQTFSVLGSANGSSYTTLAGSATYTFNPATGNTVTIPLPSGTSDQYIELNFTANSVQNGAQISELELFGP
jgi:parallel beta-helix repeat protein